MMQLWFYKVDKAAAGFLFSSSVEAEGILFASVESVKNQKVFKGQFLLMTTMMVWLNLWYQIKLNLLNVAQQINWFWINKIGWVGYY